MSIVTSSSQTDSGLPSAQPERIRTPRAASILGLSVRAVQNMAAQGKIPGAAKMGAIWTYDEVKLRNWIRELEEKTQRCRPTFIVAMASGGRGSKSAEWIDDEVYERALW